MEKEGRAGQLGGVVVLAGDGRSRGSGRAERRAAGERSLAEVERERSILPRGGEREERERFDFFNFFLNYFSYL